MSRGSAIVLADMPTKGSAKLGEQDQERLVRAIESAIEVDDIGRFQLWARGPFHALLPHESLVCLELDRRGGARQVVALHHGLIDAVAMEGLGHAEQGLALRLVRRYRGNRRQSCTADAEALGSLLPADGPPPGHDMPHNAVIHRIELISGATYFAVLINVPADRLDRCRQLLKLLSSHLKMALSRALAAPQGENPAPLTPRELEILQLMARAKSNREISGILGISAITLKSHVARLYRKLDVQNRADAVARGQAAYSLPVQGKR